MKIGDRVKGIYTGNEGVLASEPFPGINPSGEDWVHVVFDRYPDQRQAVKVSTLEVLPQEDVLPDTANSTNPKDLIGVTKPQMDTISPVALVHLAQAMGDGASKYGSFNWRSKKVQANIYYAAALRHLASWFDGEDIAEDSGVHHLAHAAACMCILLDALETGNLVDNRPPAGATARLIKEATKDA